MKIVGSTRTIGSQHTFRGSTATIEEAKSENVKRESKRSRLDPDLENPLSNEMKTVQVSYNNEAFDIDVRLSHPWDDLIRGVKEHFAVTPQHKSETLVLPNLDGVVALFTESDTRSMDSRTLEVSSNADLAPLVAKYKYPRILLNPPSRDKSSAPRRRNHRSGCPLAALCESVGNRAEKGYLTRWLFRWTHIPVFYVVAIVYAMHALSIWPIIALIFWTFTYRAKLLHVEKIIYNFEHAQNRCARVANINNKYILNLRIKLSNSMVPDKYGYYVVLGRDLRVCSYTMLPADQGMEVRLRIKHCTFVDAVIPQIAANENELDIVETNRTGQNWYNLGRNFFNVYGPFMSADHTIANAKKVAVMVQTTGSVVSDNIIYFQQIRNYWQKVLVFAVGSDLMNYAGDNIDQRITTETTVFENTDCGNFFLAKGTDRFEWMRNRIDREIKDYTSSLKASKRSRSRRGTPTHQQKSHKSGSTRRRRTTGLRAARRAGKRGPGRERGLHEVWPNSLTFQQRVPREAQRDPSDVVVIGLHRIQRNLADHCLKMLQKHDFNIIVCSGAWANHIHAVLDSDKFDEKEETPLEKARLHLELFKD
mmetsp:Transcript_22197/g.43174  ORF Transcript_22197/g.43174 Transcript_22197/m.43174 type:complete len:592 (+) Transcript_22197:90-1865(+)